MGRVYKWQSKGWEFSQEAGAQSGGHAEGLGLTGVGGG